jgi:hypothetical protein
MKALAREHAHGRVEDQAALVGGGGTHHDVPFRGIFRSPQK